MGLQIDLGTIVHKASALAKSAYAAASSPRKSEGEILPLKCCLMSISLPWECIAHDLLFKVSDLTNISYFLVYLFPIAIYDASVLAGDTSCEYVIVHA